MFGTAGGIWNEAFLDGSVSMIPRNFDYSQVSLTIGGQPPRILYGGSAPYRVWGMVQVNAVVPNGLGSGPQPVVLTVGQLTTASQPVTVFVQ